MMNNCIRPARVKEALKNCMRPAGVMTMKQAVKAVKKVMREAVEKAVREAVKKAELGLGHNH